MIITTNGNSHTVDIQRTWTPLYKRAIKFYSSFSGVVDSSDRGSTSDKYSCTFTVIDETAIINSLVDDLSKEDTQITLDTEGVKLFGQGIDHSGLFTCNVINNSKPYPIINKLQSTMTITVTVVSAITYDSAYATTLPQFIYEWPIERNIEVIYSNFDTPSTGDYGTVSINDPDGNILNTETVKISMKLFNSEFGQLHRFIANQRASSFTLSTSSFLELFLNSNSENVIITNFTYKPIQYNLWAVTLSMTNSI